MLSCNTRNFFFARNINKDNFDNTEDKPMVSFILKQKKQDHTFLWVFQLSSISNLIID